MMGFDTFKFKVFEEPVTLFVKGLLSPLWLLIGQFCFHKASDWLNAPCHDWMVTRIISLWNVTSQRQERVMTEGRGGETKTWSHHKPETVPPLIDND